MGVYAFEMENVVGRTKHTLVEAVRSRKKFKNGHYKRNKDNPEGDSLKGERVKKKR